MNLNIKLPSIATTIVGVGLGLVVALNEQVFHFGPPWQVGISTVLTVVGVLGISIISGPTFQTILHLPQATCAAIASAMGGLQLLLAQSAIESSWRTVLQVVLVIAGTLGFGPTLNAKARKLFGVARGPLGEGKGNTTQ